MSSEIKSIGRLPANSSTKSTVAPDAEVLALFEHGVEWCLTEISALTRGSS